MKAVDLYARVRRACHVEGMSQRQAARLFGIDPKTVAKMLRFSVPPGYRRSKPPARPKLDGFTGVIDRILEEDRERPRKQRHTARRIFQRLRAEHGFAGGETIVKDYVRERRLQGREMFVPLVHPPGHGQADFGEAVAVIGGEERKIHFFCLDLPHSDACFVKAYPAETAEAFCDGHNAAFAFFGGVPRSMLYDNTRLAVARILGRRHAPAHAGLRRVAVALPLRRPLRPPGQGQRQRQGRGPGRLRPAQLPGAGAAGRELRGAECPARGALPGTPGRPPARPRGEHRRAAGAGPGGDAAAARRPLRGLRDAQRPGQLAVAGALPRQRLLGAGGLRPPRGAGPRLRRGGGDRLRRGGDRPPSPRSYGREDVLLEPLHYLALLERKTGALDQAAPLAGWELPESFLVLRRLLEARLGKAGRREWVQVLRLLEVFRPEEVEAGVGEALRLGAIGFDAVKHLVLCRIERRPPRLDLEVYPYLPRARVAATSARAYLDAAGGGGRP